MDKKEMTETKDNEMNEIEESSFAFTDQDYTRIASFFQSVDDHGINSKCKFYNNPKIVSNEIIEILEKYQEQSELLDSHLYDIVKPLMFIIKSQAIYICHEKKDDNNDNTIKKTNAFLLLDHSCRIVYTLMKVRGYKTVVKSLSHEVADLELAFNMLLAVQHKERKEDTRNISWHSQYVLLLWLSLIVLIPFDLKTVDSSSNQDLIQRLIDTSLSYFTSSGPNRNASTVFLSRLLSRPDLQNTNHLKNFFEYSSSLFKEFKLNNKLGYAKSAIDFFRLLGIFETLASLFRHGSREHLLYLSLVILPGVKSIWSLARSRLLRKYSVKLAQRIGLIYLKPRLAPWRYERGNRVLLLPHSSTSTTTIIDSSSNQDETIIQVEKNQQQQSQIDDEEDEDDSFDVPDVIDDIIDHLLQGLGCRDTIIRWSAAKGIGRITGRLPRSFADDIVESLISLFHINDENDSSWHGGCLALAELARRGLLLPIRLIEVIPIVKKALLYDIIKGGHNIGTHVRDAACYTCWSFARAYHPDVMQPYVSELASHMLITACLDREVNCRRAASAAFQENVGRQGNFPYGIDIVTTADYFSLGNREHSYCHVAPFVASFEPYRYIFIQHLLHIKLVHTDMDIRVLSSKSLALICKYDSTYYMKMVLPVLLDSCLSASMYERHGNLLGLSELLLVLNELHIELNLDIQKQIRKVIISLEKLRLYRGQGGELIRTAVCSLIQSIAIVSVAYPMIISNKKIIFRYLETIHECIKHPNEYVSNNAILSLTYFTDAFLDTKKKKKEILSPSISEIQDKFISNYLMKLTDKNVAITRGYTLALGVLPISCLMPQLPTIIKTLIKTAVTLQRRLSDRDAETRRNAMKSLCNIISKARIDYELYIMLIKTDEEQQEEKEEKIYKNRINSMLSLHKIPKPFPYQSSLIIQICYCILLCLYDYSVDNRGDVGSWIRIAALEAGEILLSLFDQYHKDERIETHLSSSDNQQQYTKNIKLIFTSTYFQLIFKLMCETLNTVRHTAGNIIDHIILDNTNQSEVNISSNSEGKTLIKHYIPNYIDIQESFISSTFFALTDDMKSNSLPSSSVSSSITSSSLPQDVLSITSSALNNWTSSPQILSVMMSLLKFSKYHYFIISGLSLSIGSLSESQVKASTQAFISWLRIASIHEKQILINDMMSILTSTKIYKKIYKTQKVHVRNIIFSILKTFILLFDNITQEITKQIFTKNISLTLFNYIDDLLTSTTSVYSNDIPMLFNIVNVMIGMVSFPYDIIKKSAISTIINLLHPNQFPKMRLKTSKTLYEKLIILGETEFNLDSVEYDTVLNILAETPWDVGSFIQLHDACIRLSNLFKVERCPTPPNLNMDSTTPSLVYPCQQCPGPACDIGYGDLIRAEETG